MISFEYVTLWTTIFAYAVSSVLFILSLAFGRKRLERAAVWAAVTGLVAHGLTIGIRWVEAGHGPYLGFYEIASLMSFLTVLALVVLGWRYSGFLPVGSLIMPIAFLIIGGTMFVSHESLPISGALASPWLLIHVAFANLAYGSYALVFALSAGYLMRDYGHEGGKLKQVLDRLPDQTVIDALTYRFVGVGFVFQGIMIVSGAIWANEAWGRYWGWDTMEIWSLIAWAVYAMYLHLRLTLGWHGRRAAWVAVIALPVIVFSLLGVPIVYKSIHAAYLFR